MSTARGPRSQRGDSLYRPSAFRNQKPLILIVSEGTVTEEQYFRRVRAFFRASSVQVATCDVETLGRDPVSVVKRAIKKRDSAQIENDAQYNQVWCVVDVDEHQNLAEALELAKQNSIKVAITNPCFELWLLWHYQDHNSYISTQAVQRKLKKIIRDYDKDLPANFPYRACEEAKKRALTQGRETHTQLLVNPGATTWLVVDAIKLAKPVNTKSTPKKFTRRHSK
jgi:hypothetical protein